MTLKACLVLLLAPVAAQAAAGADTGSPKRSARAAPMRVVMSAEAWDFAANAATFLEHRSTPAMKLAAGAPPVTLKGLDFTDGTLEFDVELLDPRFVNVYFRWKSAAESECFYFRTARAGHPLAPDAVQYAPFLKGVNLWDLLGHFQTNADFRKEAWTHVRLVVSGAQLRAYVNGAARPTLSVPRLEGDVASGTIGFGGEAVVANLVIEPGAVEDLAAAPETDPLANDPRYLRSWQVTAPAVIPAGIDLSYDLIPGPNAVWTPIQAERRGLVNLSRPFGGAQGRRIAWLKTAIQSASVQTRRLALGFSDEVWVLINGKLLYVDKNWYMHPIRKEPEGRCSIENASFALPLAAGANDLVIGVANDFYGWGMVARLDSLEGINLAGAGR